MKMVLGEYAGVKSHHSCCRIQYPYIENISDYWFEIGWCMQTLHPSIKTQGVLNLLKDKK